MLFSETSAVFDCSIYGIFHISFQLTRGEECKGREPGVTEIVQARSQTRAYRAGQYSFMSRAKAGAEGSSGLHQKVCSTFS